MDRKDNSRRGRASREKGKRGEREVAKIFRESGVPEARRTVQYCGKTGDAADVTGVPGLHIEVKHVEREAVRTWYGQAARDAAAAGKGNLPVVIHRKSHSPWLITMSLKDFIDIFQEKEREGKDDE